jgi:hypothetical protein
MADRAEFLTALSALAGSFRSEMTDPMIAGYWLALEHVQAETLWEAVKKAVTHDKFMPPPARLRELALESAKDAYMRRPLPSVGRSDELRMGREVSIERMNLIKQGWCALCATGEAIHLVGVAHGGDPFDWRGKDRASGHRCNCVGTRPATKLYRDTRLPREYDDEDEEMIP